MKNQFSHVIVFQYVTKKMSNPLDTVNGAFHLRNGSVDTHFEEIKNSA